jgi:SAM-dependent methyltransferase
MVEDHQALEVLEKHQRVWMQKPVLRRIYQEEFFSRQLAQQKFGGISIEVGGGPGFFKKALPPVVSTDLIWSPWLDVVADAQRLPFLESSVSNVFGLDVLHHLAAPVSFLREAERVLAPGGRLILVEPWVTPFSFVIYRYLHQEDCNLSFDPYEHSHPDGAAAKKAFDGNQAIPYLLVGPRNRDKTMALLPQLTVRTLEQFCLFAYLLSFGFKRVNFLPEFLYPGLAKFERVTLPLWRRVASLRALIVLEKRDPFVVRPVGTTLAGERSE